MELSIFMRSIFSLLTAFAVMLGVGRFGLRQLKRYQIGETVRDYVPEGHQKKGGTPTMGGLFILVAVTMSTLIWADLQNYYVWLVLAALLGFGVIGFWDDYKKLIVKDPKGLAARWKYGWQSLLALGIVVFLYTQAQTSAETAFMVRHWVCSLGFGYLVLSYFVIVGASNAVNLTDGLDGLAIMPVVLVAAVLALLAGVMGGAPWARYFFVADIPAAREMAIFCSALVGAGLGFLWFNAYPALIFMGDVGALALGAALGVVAVVLRQEVLLFLMGGLFVAETVSVILQVASFTCTGKRIFRMAPLHHHFELKGWPESRIIVRFWIMSVLLAVLGVLVVVR